MSVGVLTAALAAIAVMPAAAAPAAVVVTEKTAIARAEAVLDTQRETVAATQDDDFRIVRTIVDPDGSSHVRYSRTYQGLPVYGGDIVVHNRPDGTYDGSSVGLAAPLRLDIRPSIADKDAIEIARRAFAGKVDKVADPVLVIDAADGVGRLAYETVASGTALDEQTPSVLHVFVDALTGEVIRSVDEIEQIIFSPEIGTGDTYYSGKVQLRTTYTDLYPGPRYRLIDQPADASRTCDMGNGTTTCTPVVDSDNIWGDGTLADRQTVAADAHYGMGVAYDYFRNTHGQYGISGDGRGVSARVHFGDQHSNASWWGGARTMTFGDGDDNQHPFVTLDVVGHEWTHGVTESLAGLIYGGESGALNEATSDIFGAAMEFYTANPADPGEYEIGEKIDDTPPAGGAIRYLYNPGADGLSYSCYWGKFPDTFPVHFSSGVANHFFFNLAEGNGDTPWGYSPLCQTGLSVTGIGREAAEKIWFRALNVYFVSNTGYSDQANPANTARAYTIKAASDLYGRCSPQAKAVNAAWLSVNVPGPFICSKLEVDIDHLVVFTADTGAVTIITHPGTEPATLEFSASGLPEGVGVTFRPERVQAGDKASMSVAVADYARPGTYLITITARSKEDSDSVTLELTVLARK
ncbi:MAG: M4 family metallopeptidase [Hamadaea sp.]|nr:M4 family metallopeptidase [Hamadaea sp.]NUR46997.1 M4 family metallopeptidase [Hamadaea sp.]NUT08553.1 M4 family metallopeptidase [Hamadaea sp.]